MTGALALALVWVEVLAYGANPGDRVMAIVLGACATAAFLSPWKPAPARAVLVLAAVEALAAIPRLSGLYAPGPGATGLVPLGEMLLVIRDAVLWLQVALLLIHPASLPRAARNPAFFILLGAAAMAASGTLEDSSRENLPYQVLIACFCAVAILFAWPKQHAPRIAAGAMLMQGILFLIAVGAATGSSQLIAKHGNDLDGYLAKIVTPPQQSAGFSRNASLNAINRLRGQDDTIALRVYSDTMPGYLRACAYDTYFQQRWSATQEGNRLAERLVQVGDSTKFRIGVGTGNVDAAMEVWQEPAVRDALFLPQNTAAVTAATAALSLDAHQAALPVELDTRPASTGARGHGH